jgi:hypothetical protein
LDDLFTILIVAFLIVGPLLEKLLKGRRGEQRPQQGPQHQRPGQRAQRQRLPEGRTTTEQRQRLPDGRTTTVAGPGTDRESATPAQDATDLLPADLWQILTGQQPVPEATARYEPEPEPEPEPLPRRAPVAERPQSVLAKRRAADEEKRLQRRSASVTRTAPADEERQAAELILRRERTQAARRRFDHSAPRIASLETEPASETLRHDAFHDRLDRLRKPATVRTQNVRIDVGLDINDNASLRRAILQQEILGRPKGLD